MLYEMTTGQRPFAGRVEVVLAQHVQVEPTRPRKLNRAIPRVLETIILKCLQKEPAQRYPHGDALAAYTPDEVRGDAVSLGDVSGSEGVAVGVLRGGPVIGAQWRELLGRGFRAEVMHGYEDVTQISEGVDPELAAL